MNLAAAPLAAEVLASRATFPSLDELSGRDLREQSFFCPEITTQTPGPRGGGPWGTVSWQSADPRKEGFCDCYFAGYPSLGDPLGLDLPGGDPTGTDLPAPMSMLPLPSSSSVVDNEVEPCIADKVQNIEKLSRPVAYPTLGPATKPGSVLGSAAEGSLAEAEVSTSALLVSYPSLSLGGDEAEALGSSASATSASSPSCDGALQLGAVTSSGDVLDSSAAGGSPESVNPVAAPGGIAIEQGGKKRVTFATTATAVSVLALDESMRATPVYKERKGGGTLPCHLGELRAGRSKNETSTSLVKSTSKYGGVSFHGAGLFRNDSAVKVEMPFDLVSKFAAFVQPNTGRNVETCGWLVGRKDARQNLLQIEYVLLPPQRGDDVSCQATDEMTVFEWMMNRKRAMIFGRLRLGVFSRRGRWCRSSWERHRSLGWDHDQQGRVITINRVACGWNTHWVLLLSRVHDCNFHLLLLLSADQ